MQKTAQIKLKEENVSFLDHFESQTEKTNGLFSRRHYCGSCSSRFSSMNLAIIYGETTRVKHIESEIIRIYADEGAAYTILNIELQKHPPSRHRGNYYACGHRGLRTNNPELRIGRKGRGEGG